MPATGAIGLESGWNIPAVPKSSVSMTMNVSDPDRSVWDVAMVVCTAGSWPKLAGPTTPWARLGFG